jgi:hypothetical protein
MTYLLEFGQRFCSEDKNFDSVIISLYVRDRGCVYFMGWNGAHLLTFLLTVPSSISIHIWLRCFGEQEPNNGVTTAGKSRFGRWSRNEDSVWPFWLRIERNSL